MSQEIYNKLQLTFKGLPTLENFCSLKEVTNLEGCEETLLDCYLFEIAKNGGPLISLVTDRLYK